MDKMGQLARHPSVVERLEDVGRSGGAMDKLLETAWCVVGAYPDRFGAEAEAGFLRSQGVSAIVQVIGDFPGHDRGSRILVPAPLGHRAAWLLKLAPVSEAELTYLATRELPSSEGCR